MPRKKKTESDEAINADIGARLAELRREKHWSLADLSERIGISVAHLSALEGGLYSFSAALLLKLSTTFGRPVTAFLGNEPPEDTLDHEWRGVFDALTQRDRVVLIDLARRLASWSGTFVQQGKKPKARASGHLVALEGVDGALLNDLGQRMEARLGAKHCPYDYQTDLWRYMIARLHELDDLPHRAFERTLLFACERLHRQEAQVRPALAEGRAAVVSFFAMAPSVYQEMEGLGDRRVIDIVEALLFKPDLIILVRSDPRVAARKVVRHRPGPGQFYSPYHRVEEFERAQDLYEKAVQEYRSLGYQVGEINVDGDTLSDDVIVMACESASRVVSTTA